MIDMHIFEFSTVEHRSSLSMSVALERMDCGRAKDLWYVQVHESDAIAESY